jgi:hypothetical protein
MRHAYFVAIQNYPGTSDSSRSSLLTKNMVNPMARLIPLRKLMATGLRRRTFETTIGWSVPDK